MNTVSSSRAKNMDIQISSEHPDTVVGSIFGSESDAQNAYTEPVEEDSDADIIEHTSAVIGTKRIASTTVSDQALPKPGTSYS
jgi:hypothetical protein